MGVAARENIDTCGEAYQSEHTQSISEREVFQLINCFFIGGGCLCDRRGAHTTSASFQWLNNTNLFDNPLTTTSHTLKHTLALHGCNPQSVVVMMLIERY